MGDSNTGVFFKSVLENLSKNIIHFLCDDHDTKFSDLQQYQVSFVKEMLLCENVLLALELVSDFHKEGETTRVCLHIDISKGYENVNWYFIINILEDLKLSDIFIKRIQFKLAFLLLTIRCHPRRADWGFQGKKGLRQEVLLFIDGNNVASARLLASSFGLLQGSLPVCYLGLPIMPHKLRLQDYQPLLDKVKVRISSWTVHRLYFVGRLQLIHAVLFSIINFWSSFFPLPKGCLEALDKICNYFLWSGAPNSARGAKVSSKFVCTLKKEGGLGLRNLHDSNKVFGLKLIWLLFSSIGCH